MAKKKTKTRTKTTKTKNPSKKSKKPPHSDDDPDEFVWMELTGDNQMEHVLAPTETLLRTEGLSLGDRLGTIAKLEQIEEMSVPPIAKKAGLSLALKGAQIRLVPTGELLSIGELHILAEWLLEEAGKAAEDYDISL